MTIDEAIERNKNIKEHHRDTRKHFANDVIAIQLGIEALERHRRLRGLGWPHTSADIIAIALAPLPSEKEKME